MKIEILKVLNPITKELITLKILMKNGKVLRIKKTLFGDVYL